MALTVYRYGVFLPRCSALTDPKTETLSDLDVVDVQIKGYNRIVEVLDDASLITAYNAGFDRICAIGVVSRDTAKAADTTKFLTRCVSLDSISRSALMLTATLIEFRNTNHHVGQGVGEVLPESCHLLV